jgi:Tfp pilus assembly PilM family ATPase
MDCCDTSCKAVVLSRRGSGIRVTGANYLSCQTEGFLSAGELHHAFGEWLAQNNLRKHPACCGIPQYHVNTLISDLPPVSNRQKLAQMVDYQTRHLGGLTGEELLNDFQELPPTPNQANPVLIALCRSSVLEERLEYLTDLRALVTQFTGNGIALAHFAGIGDVSHLYNGNEPVSASGLKNCISPIFPPKPL